MFSYLTVDEMKEAAKYDVTLHISGSDILMAARKLTAEINNGNYFIEDPRSQDGACLVVTEEKVAETLKSLLEKFGDNRIEEELDSPLDMLAHEHGLFREREYTDFFDHMLTVKTYGINYFAPDDAPENLR